jgi:hypothetical protein
VRGDLFMSVPGPNELPLALSDSGRWSLAAGQVDDPLLDDNYLETCLHDLPLYLE